MLDCHHMQQLYLGRRWHGRARAGATDYYRAEERLRARLHLVGHGGPPRLQPRPGQRGQQARPVEARAGIGLPAWRDLAVRSDRPQRNADREAADELGELAILGVLERRIVGALELDADRK